MAVMNGFLKFSSIKGGAKDKNHENWVKFSTISFNMSNADNYQKIGNGNYSVSNITVTKTEDISTPQIQDAVINGKVDECILEFINPAFPDEVTCTYKLSGAKMRSYSLVTDEHGVNKEVIVISFSRYEVRYIPYDKEHKAQSALIFTCDAHKSIS